MMSGDVLGSRLRWNIDDRFAATRADLHDSFLQNFAACNYLVAVNVAEAYIGAVAHLMRSKEQHLLWRLGLRSIRKRLRHKMQGRNGVRDSLLDWWILFNFDLAKAGLKEEREESWEKQATKLE